MAIVVEEADEAGFWLEFLVEIGLTSRQKTAALQKESSELVAIFTASAVPAAVGAALGALRVIRSDGPALMAKLLDNAAYLRQEFRDLGLRVVEPGTLPDGSEANTPVVPVLVGEDWQAVLLWKALFDAGVYTNVALHPAVPPGGALLRTSLMATHEREHLDRALAVFERTLAEFPDVPRSG